MTDNSERAALALAAQAATVTRFAPSPSGNLHIGNARTALFSFLLARRVGGRFILRIEDTDAARSSEEFCRNQQDDLIWLGLEWDAGPGREDERGPYRQSQRVALYAQHFVTLAQQDRVYECYCTALELEISRKSQIAAGKPPRYAGTCAHLSPEQRSAKRAAGLAPTLRFRVPAGERIEFVDFVHGAQTFLSDDIGDFIVRRADGSAAFFFSNAVDDAAMGVNRVLRGEDHLSNSPRQILVLQALGAAGAGVRPCGAAGGCGWREAVETAWGDHGAGISRAGVHGRGAVQSPVPSGAFQSGERLAGSCIHGEGFRSRASGPGAGTL